MAKAENKIFAVGVFPLTSSVGQICGFVQDVDVMGKTHFEYYTDYRVLFSV